MSKILGSWSGMRKYLEKEMLAECLQGRVRYNCTTFVGMDGCHIFELYIDDNLIKQFCTTFSLLLDALHIAQKDFRTLIFTEDEAEGLVRTFQVVFLAIYELLHIEHMVVDDMAGFVKSLDGIGVTVLKGIVKEYWNAESRFKRIQAVKGVLRSSFRQGTGCDVAKDNWVIQIDNIEFEVPQQYSKRQIKIRYSNDYKNCYVVNPDGGLDQIKLLDKKANGQIKRKQPIFDTEAQQ